MFPLNVGAGRLFRETTGIRQITREKTRKKNEIFVFFLGFLGLFGLKIPGKFSRHFSGSFSTSLELQKPKFDRFRPTF